MHPSCGNTRTIKRLKAVACEAAGTFRDRGRTVKKRLLEIAKVLRRRTGEAYQEVRQITGEIMDVTKEVTRAANRVTSRVKEAIEKATDDRVVKTKKLIERLESQIAVTEKVIQQTQEYRTATLISRTANLRKLPPTVGSHRRTMREK